MLRDLEILVLVFHVTAKSESLERYISAPSAPILKGLQSRFTTFIADRKIYSQLRYIAATGQGVIHINQKNGVVQAVAEDQLQNKKSRYYFQQTAALKSGGISLSRLDLNVEFGEVDRPFIPLLRLATPVIDDKGDFVGIVIVNYRAERMLNRFQKANSQDSLARYSLVNRMATGYWLKADDPLWEWGGIYSTAHRDRFNLGTEAG